MSINETITVREVPSDDVATRAMVSVVVAMAVMPEKPDPLQDWHYYNDLMQLVALINSPVVVFAAFNDEGPVAGAVMNCLKGASHARLQELGTLPEYRGKGIGAALLTVVSKDFPRCTVAMRKPSLAAFYQANGFPYSTKAFDCRDIVCANAEGIFDESYFQIGPAQDSAVIAAVQAETILGRRRLFNAFRKSKVGDGRVLRELLSCELAQSFRAAAGQLQKQLETA